MTYEIIRATRTDDPASSAADMYELARAIAQVRNKQQPIIIMERVRPSGPNTSVDQTLKNLVSAPLGYSHSTLLFCMSEAEVRDPEHMKGAFCYGGWNQVAEIPEVLVPGEESLPRIRFQFDDGRHFVVDEEGQSGRLLKIFLKTFGDLGFVETTEAFDERFRRSVSEYRSSLREAVNSTAFDNVPGLARFGDWSKQEARARMLACLLVDEAYHTIELTRLLEEVERVSAVINGLVQQENGSDMPKLPW